MKEVIALFEDKLNESINLFTWQRKRMFILVRRYKYSLVALSALSTIVLGLQLDLEFITIQKNTALVIGAIVTALTSLMTFWNVEEYWIQNKVIEQQLKELRFRFEFEKTSGMDEERLRELSKEYQTIVKQQQSYWKGALDEKTEGSEK